MRILAPSAEEDRYYWTFEAYGLEPHAARGGMEDGVTKGTAGIVMALASLAAGVSACWRVEGAAGQPAGPPPLSSHVMVFHDSLRMTVMFGGTDTAGVPTNVVWGWDGESWHRLAEGGPGARLHAGMAYDVDRNRLVVYGGIRERASSWGDTWGWDGRAWERRHPGESTDGVTDPAVDARGSAGWPGVRDHHAMAYDRARGVTVLFGGQSGDDQYLSDTWEWDGARWTRVDVPGPPARSTHRLAWEAANQRVVLVAGWGPDGVLGDAWSYDGTRWTVLRSAGLPPRGATRFTTVGEGDEIVLFGGLMDGQPEGGTWIRDRAGDWRRVETAGPPARNVHAMAWDPVRRRVVLYGGIGAAGKMGDLWEWDGEVWERRWTSQ